MRVLSVDDPRVHELFVVESQRLSELAEAARSRGDERTCDFYLAFLGVVNRMYDDLAHDPRPAPEVVRFLVRRHG